jgi:hypothetical protein
VSQARLEQRRLSVFPVPKIPGEKACFRKNTDFHGWKQLMELKIYVDFRVTTRIRKQWIPYKFTIYFHRKTTNLLETPRSHFSHFPNIQ